MNKFNFTGVFVKKDVLFDQRLSSTEKLLTFVIESLAGDDGCYASNEYLCQSVGASLRSIQYGLAKLRKIGFITIKNLPSGRRMIEMGDEFYKNNLNSKPVEDGQDLPTCDEKEGGAKSAGGGAKIAWGGAKIAHRSDISNRYNINSTRKRGCDDGKSLQPVDEPLVMCNTQQSYTQSHLKSTEKTSDVTNKSLHKSKGFIAPEPAEVQEYAKTIDFKLDGAEFCDYYESVGWMVGRKPMKSWKAAVRTWKARRIPKDSKPSRYKSLEDLKKEGLL